MLKKLFIILIVLVSINIQIRAQNIVQEKWDNGAIKAEGKKIGNKKEGEWKYYTKKGHIRFIVNYQNEKPNGICKFFYTGGQLKELGRCKGSFIESINYVNIMSFKRIGEWKVYFKNGKLKEKGSYKDDGKESQTKNGLWVEYFENGKKKVIENYTNGKKYGVRKSYYSSGILQSTIDFEKKLTKQFYKSGELMSIQTSIGSIIHSGYKKMYYKSGEIAIERYFKNKKKIGIWKEYYVTGVKKQTVHFNTNQLTKFYENGKIRMIANLSPKRLNYKNFYNFFTDAKFLKKNGKIHAEVNYSAERGWKEGEYIEYFSNGKVKTKCNYIRGKVYGELMTYYENGNLKFVGNYKKGIKEGESRYYSEESSLNKIVIYKNGEEIKSTSYN